MKVHVAKGPALAHDHERPYNMLKREDGLADESYKADVRDPAYLEAMAFVNNLCARDRALPPGASPEWIRRTCSPASTSTRTSSSSSGITRSGTRL